jgi:glycosyltransferase domain-containing protein
MKVGSTEPSPLGRAPGSNEPDERGEAAMQDFTLVIPTYNRPKPLGALLDYLRAKQSSCRILILDSSQPQPRAANRKVIELAKLKLDYAEFPSEMHPFDKFREGLHGVTTEFCALCADDDLVVLDGVTRCLEALRCNPQASVAQGYSFSFLCHQNGDMDLGNILYFSSTIDDATPLGRLAKLFARYQAATYGNYRTPVLQRIFDTLEPMTSILARELLGSALAAVEGQMIRVPCFSHGRSMDASESYQHWHPLEWFAKDPQGLLSEYHFYRELMAEAVLERPDNTLDAAAVRRVLDLVHLRYMVKHAPDGVLAFMTEQKMCGVPFDEYWPRHEIHQPLYEAAYIGTSAPAWTQAAHKKNSRVGDGRTYNLHPNFSAPLGIGAPGDEAISDLLHSLDHYRFRPAAAVPVRVTSPLRTRQALRRSVTVSVLLCNYNDARYLPDSLSAICTQTRLPEEVIVLDDGSTDNSLEIIEGFARRYPFIRVLKNETNRGLLYSINRTLTEARCDFIVWAAADDRLMPNFVARNAQCLRQYPAAGMTLSRLAVFRDGSDEITSFTKENHGIAFDFGTAARFLSPEMLRDRLQQSYLWISANTVMARRTALLQAGGFDQELRWHADHFGFLAVALRHGVCCIPETLALMRQRDQTYSSAGMAKRVEQRATLGRLADKLTTKGWRDIGIAALRCPSLLSPFGGLMLEALLLKPRRWPFAVTYGLWWANHQWGQRSGVAARIGSRSARMGLQAVLAMLREAGRFVHWARRT